MVQVMTIDESDDGEKNHDGDDGVCDDFLRVTSSFSTLFIIIVIIIHDNNDDDNNDMYNRSARARLPYGSSTP